MQVSVKVNTEVLRRAYRLCVAPRPLMAAAAGAVKQTLQRHFLLRNAEPNAKGWPKKNFWTLEGFKKTSVGRITDNSAVVNVASPAVAHKLLGGVVRPGPGRRALAIPLTARAYMAGSPSLGVIPDLFILRRPGKNPLLVAGHGAALVAHYALVTSVQHRPDPRTLPTDQAINQAAGAAAQAALERELRRKVA